MKVLSWNVNGTFPPQGSPDQITDQIGWLNSLETLPDILLLQEVNPNQRDLWQKLLTDRLGYKTVRDTLDTAVKQDNSNGHITATQGEFDIVETTTGNELNETTTQNGPDHSTAYPEKLLVTKIEYGKTTIEVWNIRAVPGGSYPEEKLNILELAYEHIKKTGEKPRIFAGDLNTPQRELADGQAITYGYQRDADLQRRGVTAELKILKGLGHFGMIDVFRANHGYGDIDPLSVSHDGRRIDHLFASETLSPTDCWYSEPGATHSDHAPILTVFDI
jgi:exonuclease III